MSIPAQRTGWSWAARLAVAFTGFGSVCVVASILIAYLIADHSSSDSSPSSLAAVGLGGVGFLSALLGAVLFVGAALARVRRGSHTAQPTRSDPSECLAVRPVALSPAIRTSAPSRRPPRHGNVIAA
jgi:hypothetical protein